MTDQLGPDSLRALKKQIGWSDTPAKIDAHADAWDDDIWREDVYDENYRKELAKNAALRKAINNLAICPLCNRDIGTGEKHLPGCLAALASQPEVKP